MNTNDKVVIISVPPVFRDSICKVGLKGYIEAIEVRDNAVKYIFFQSEDVCGWLPEYCVKVRHV